MPSRRVCARLDELRGAGCGLWVWAVGVRCGAGLAFDDFAQMFAVSDLSKLTLNL